MTEPSYQVVVSSENSQYMAWQTQLFCFSALSRLGQRPIIVVHVSEPLRQEFQLLKERGFRVLEAPSARTHPVQEYAPRNELGSLLAIASLSDVGSRNVLFCEPDMLFVKRLAYDDHLAGEYYGYLNYDQERLTTVAAKFGIRHMITTLNRTSKIGVPYLLPFRDVPRVASKWIEVLDAFKVLEWIDIMYAFGLALSLEELTANITHNASHNGRMAKWRSASRPIIHYCYGDAIWSKRTFIHKSALDVSVQDLPSARQGSILGEIVMQIREAKAYFLEDYVTRRDWVR